MHDPVAAVTSGLDLRMPGRPGDPRVRTALKDGSLTEATVDQVAERLRLLADRTAATSRPDADLEANHQLVRRAAAESAVLLHNTEGLLPINPAAVGSVAVIGELARTPRYQGAGSSAVDARRVVSAIDALHQRLPDVRFAAGYTLEPGQDTASMVQEAVAAAEATDLVVLFLGLPASYEAEGRDRTSIDLPADEVALVEAIAAVNPHIVVALSNGSAVSTRAWRPLRRRHRRVLAHRPGPRRQHRRRAPRGRQPLRQAARNRARPPRGHLRLPRLPRRSRARPGQRRHPRRLPLVPTPVTSTLDYPFGHGLSYTTFHYDDLQVTVHDLNNPIALTVSLTVTNTGDREGAEVVQVYVGDRSDILQMPQRELRAFTKVPLAPGATQPVQLTIARADLQHYHPDAGWIFTGGHLNISVGSSSRYSTRPQHRLPGIRCTFL